MKFFKPFRNVPVGHTFCFNGSLCKKVSVDKAWVDIYGMECTFKSERVYHNPNNRKNTKLVC